MPADFVLPRTLMPGAGYRLAAYGTLRPGAIHHHLLADCRGVWRHALVRGHLHHHDYPVLTPDPNGPFVAVQWLASADLPSRWRALDDFEGDGYRRILAPIWSAAGHLFTVANLYVRTVP